jgi:hypothetical protein
MQPSDARFAACPRVRFSRRRLPEAEIERARRERPIEGARIGDVSCVTPPGTCDLQCLERSRHRSFDPAIPHVDVSTGEAVTIQPAALEAGSRDPLHRLMGGCDVRLCADGISTGSERWNTDPQ